MIRLFALALILGSAFAPGIQDDRDTLVVSIGPTGEMRANGIPIYRPSAGAADTRRLKDLFQTRRLMKRYQEVEGDSTYVRYPLLILADRRTPFEHIQLLMMIASIHGGVTRIRLAFPNEAPREGILLPRATDRRPRRIPEMERPGEVVPVEEIRINLCVLDDDEKGLREHSRNKARHEALLQARERKDLEATGSDRAPHLILNDVCLASVGQGAPVKLFRSWVCSRAEHQEDRQLSREQRIEANGKHCRILATRAKALWNGKDPVILDACGSVPYEHVIGVVRACRAIQIERIEFVASPRFYRGPRFESYKPKDLRPDKKLLDRGAPADDPELLIKKLASPGFAAQGKAAEALLRMGPKAIPALERARKHPDAQVRDWVERILARTERIRTLIAGLGSEDATLRRKAAQELRAIGKPAVPFLREASRIAERAKEILESIEKNEDFKKFKGDSLDFKSDKPFKGKGTYDTIGGAGCGGGRYGGRLGGMKKARIARGGGGNNTEDAVLAALKWLARHQGEDGSWAVKAYDRHCNRLKKYVAGGRCEPNPGREDLGAGVTGLAILAFLGAGYTHRSRDTYDGIRFGDVVKKGLQWMIKNQDPEGCIGSRSVKKYMYSHLICALALSEAYGMTGSRIFKDQAQRAVDFTVAAQNPGKGWRYSFRSGENDSSVTGWAVMALKSAELSGLSFPRSAYDGALAWFDSVTDDTYYRVGYTFKNSGKVYVAGLNEKFNHHEALTAIGVMTRIFVEKKKGDKRIAGGAALLLRDLPKWEGNDIDFYYWYHASLALYQYDGPGGPKWGQWNKAMKEALVRNQNSPTKGCRSGSWEPVGRWCGEGGRVYATAINCLTLEVYYRYASGK